MLTELAVNIGKGLTLTVKVVFPLQPDPADPNTVYDVVEIGFNVKLNPEIALGNKV